MKMTWLLESESSSSFTHLYAPPEYLVGKPASVRGDIYSLGVILFQMAVGDLSRPLGSGWRRSIGDNLLAEDIRRCVDVEEEQRFQSASHLAQHLETLEERHALDCGRPVSPMSATLNFSTSGQVRPPSEAAVEPSTQQAPPHARCGHASTAT